MTTFDCADPVARRAGLEAAAHAARTGNLVVMPTDTVYGIGADAFNAAAVRDLARSGSFAIVGRSIRYGICWPRRVAGPTCRYRCWSGRGPRSTGW